MVKGYKVFNPGWVCLDKVYTCPGTFEEEGAPNPCEHGMHFCKRLVDCFNYYDFDPRNKVAEVEAYGDVAELGNKCCTNKLRIIRELTWAEVLALVNHGNWNDGLANTGSVNHGDRNSGGNNYGNANTADHNAGDLNSGNCNIGNCNSGFGNKGDRNTGKRNMGDSNSGDRNSGDVNTGFGNIGDGNSGNWNIGNWNSGDWNMTDNSSGCFNTEEQRMFMFNKPSPMLRSTWEGSRARYLLSQMPHASLCRAFPTDEAVGGNITEAEAFTNVRMQVCKTSKEERMGWWHDLSEDDRRCIMSLPNFDADLFMEITSIDVRE